MNNPIVALNALRVQIEDFLLKEGIPLKMRNRRLDVTDKAWARFSYMSADSSPAELGGNKIRDTGIVVISLFLPLNSGVFDGDRIAYGIRDTFSEIQIQGLETSTGSVNDVPSTEDFYHINITLPYRHN